MADAGALLDGRPDTLAVTLAGKPESSPRLEALFGDDGATGSDNSLAVARHDGLEWPRARRFAPRTR